MTNRKNIQLPGQQNLFEWVKEQTSERLIPSPPPGSLDIDAKLRAAISEDLKHAKDQNGREISRYEVAAKMSDLVGQEITASMLYNWTAESHDKNNFPLKLLPAFVAATRGRKTVELACRECGLIAMLGAEALRAEVSQLDEEIERLIVERKKRKLFLREIGARDAENKPNGRRIL